jgi:hypothetical protein
MKALAREAREYSIRKNEEEFRNRLEYAQNKADEGDFRTARRHLVWAVEALSVLAYHNGDDIPD